jgi:putative ABC transport system permease protein
MHDWKKEIASRLRDSSIRPEREAEIAEELGGHLEDRARELMRTGVSQTEARNRALDELLPPAAVSDIAATTPRFRSSPPPGEADTGDILSDLITDIRVGARGLRRAPAFTVTALLTIAVGIGALAAVYSVVNAILVRPLPFEEPNRVVQIWSGPGATAHGPTSPANFIDYRASITSLSAVAAEDFGWFDVAGGNDSPPVRVYGAKVSPSFFAAVGVRPALGRAFANHEEDPDAHAVILSHGLWQSRFGAKQDIVGQPVIMNGERYDIVGVMPPAFDFPSTLIGSRVELWVPLAWRAGQADRGMRRLGMTARLVDGITLEQAQVETNAIAQRLASTFPKENDQVGIRLVPLRDEIVGSTSRVLLLLLASVGVVLLIACANVANLMLARAQARHHEFAIRAVLGAGRGRLARQALAEALVLSAGGGVLGIAFAAILARVIVSLNPDALPSVRPIGVDWRVMLFALGAAVLTGLITGVGAAVKAGAGQLGGSARDVGRVMSAGRPQVWIRRTLVGAEVSLAVVLLVTGGLLLRSLRELTMVDPGFIAKPVLTAGIVLSKSRYPTPADRSRHLDAAIQSVAALPGVVNVGATTYLPFGRGDLRLDISVEGVSSTANDAPSAHVRAVTPEYFSTLQIPVLRGRMFQSADRGPAPTVAVVNNAFVQKYWPGISPEAVIGKRIALGTTPTASDWLAIVGIVGDVKHWTLDEKPSPEMYLSLLQAPAASYTLVVRSSGNAGALESAVRGALLSVDKSQPAMIRTMQTLVSNSVAQQRFRSVLLGAFAAVALLMAIVGVYGVVSYDVTQRTKEIGVRMAIGAQQGNIIRMTLRHGMGAVAAGLILGCGGAYWAGRSVRAMLFNIDAVDVVTYVGVCAVVVLTALIANYIPARRAVRIDPVTAIRGD